MTPTMRLSLAPTPISTTQPFPLMTRPQPWPEP